MSPALKTLLIWAGVILLLSYMFRLNLPNIVQSVVHGIQTVRNSQGH